jgi:ABC-type lipoprotein release transport system permease subunit
MYLTQLGEEEAVYLLRSSERVVGDVYVDKLLTKTQNLSEALKLQRNVKQLLQRQGFTLHKWRSCNTEILSIVPLGQRKNEFPLKLMH